MRKKIMSAVFLGIFFVASAFVGLNYEKNLTYSNFSENSYSKVERVFEENATHSDDLINFVNKKVLPDIRKREKFLDIGAGPGDITGAFSHHFNKTTVVEPNSKFYKTYEEKKIDRLIPSNFQDISLDENYDFILCSHMLYHIDKKDWKAELAKMYQNLAPGGVAVVSLVAPRGNWHDLRSSINPEYGSSLNVENALNELNIEYQKKKIKNSFVTEDQEAFRELLYLFTIDDCYLPKDFKKISSRDKEKFYSQINGFLLNSKRGDGKFELIYEDDYIVMRK